MNKSAIFYSESMLIILEMDLVHDHENRCSFSLRTIESCLGQADGKHIWAAWDEDRLAFVR